MSVANIALATLKKASANTRRWAKANNISPVLATRGMNDAVRDAIASHPTRSVNNSLNNWTNFVSSGSRSPRGFNNEVMENIGFLWDYKHGNPGRPVPSEFRVPKVKRGTVSNADPRSRVKALARRQELKQKGKK